MQLRWGDLLWSIRFPNHNVNASRKRYTIVNGLEKRVHVREMSCHDAPMRHAAYSNWAFLATLIATTTKRDLTALLSIPIRRPNPLIRNLLHNVASAAINFKTKSSSSKPSRSNSGSAPRHHFLLRSIFLRTARISEAVRNRYALRPWQHVTRAIGQICKPRSHGRALFCPVSSHRVHQRTRRKRRSVSHNQDSDVVTIEDYSTLRRTRLRPVCTENLALNSIALLNGPSSPAPAHGQQNFNRLIRPEVHLATNNSTHELIWIAALCADNSFKICNLVRPTVTVFNDIYHTSSKRPWGSCHSCISGMGRRLQLQQGQWSAHGLRAFILRMCSFRTLTIMGDYIFHIQKSHTITDVHARCIWNCEITFTIALWWQVQLW